MDREGRTLATGDDFGFVKLFDYPCQGKFSKFKKYSGHSSHVTRVRWTNQDFYLVSLGGNDTSIIVWENLAKIIVESGDLNKSVSSELVLRNRHKGDSDDSDTDDEDEGYDSDVRREHRIDFSANIFKNIVNKPAPEVIKSMLDEAIAIDKT